MIKVKHFLDAAEGDDGQRLWVEPISLARDLREWCSVDHVLCHLGPEPKPLAEVPGDHHIKGNGKTLVERHLIAVVTQDRTGSKLVALTDRGQAVMHHHPLRLETVEAEWRERFGDSTITAVRDALEPLAAEAQDQPAHVVAPLHFG